jgi:hypothetical protein
MQVEPAPLPELVPNNTNSNSSLTQVWARVVNYMGVVKVCIARFSLPVSFILSNSLFIIIYYYCFSILVYFLLLLVLLVTHSLEGFMVRISGVGTHTAGTGGRAFAIY